MITNFYLILTKQQSNGKTLLAYSLVLKLIIVTTTYPTQYIDSIG